MTDQAKLVEAPTDAERLVEEISALIDGKTIGSFRIDVEDARTLLSSLTSKDEEIASLRARGDQHWETLRSIRDMARAGDCERIIQWVNDAGTGYVETAQRTLSSSLDRAQAAESLTLSLRAENERLRGVLDLIERTAESFCRECGAGVEFNHAEAFHKIDMLAWNALDALSQSTGDTK